MQRRRPEEGERARAERPLVAHYRHRYLELTETFIAETVRCHECYAPVVVTHERTDEDDPSVTEPVRLAAADGVANRVPGLRRSALLELCRWRRALAAEIRQLRPAVLHAHFGPEGVAAAPVAQQSGVPLVVTFYGVDATYLARHALWRRRFRSLFAHAKSVLAEGPSMRARLVALGCREDRVALQPIPIRLQRLAFHPPEAPRDGRVVIAQACRLVAKKGVDVTIEAFARLHSRWPRAELWLIGDGPDRPGLERLARDRGVAANVIFHGACTYERYIELLRGAHVFAHPSRTAGNGDAEGGAPTTLVEAQALGLPIVASNHDDIPFVTAADAALLARENDAAGLSTLLDHLLRHPAEWAARARAGRTLVEAQHDPTALNRRLERVYDDVRRSSGGAGR